MHIYINKKYLTFKNFKAKCSVGKGGVDQKKREGDLITPKGTFRIKEILYRSDRVKNLKSNIKLLPIKKNMGWCDDPKSIKYNKKIKYPFEFSAESLFRSDNSYDIILVLSFNMKPIKKNKGSAIFLHIAKKKYSPTKGCIAIKKKKFRELLKLINKRTLIKIH